VDIATLSSLALVVAPLRLVNPDVRSWASTICQHVLSRYALETNAEMFCNVYRRGSRARRGS
jgi:hypothetical protein